MADSKIDFSFENLHFSCEGDNAWVEKQLNNVLSRIPALLTVHKKGENIVEEVIEVSEEDVKEVAKKDPRVPKSGSGKKSKVSVSSKKKKAEKVVKEKAADEKTVKEKIAKEPKVKKVKAPKAEKVEKEKAVNEPVIKPDKPAKRGRKPKKSEKSVAKVKVAKKKIAAVKPVVEQIDSPLYQFIVEKKAAKNQVRKFLAIAVFLTKSNNIAKLSTSMISKALKSYGIKKLQNASDCLNKNEKKGYCIKEGKEFIITENGYLSIE